MIKIENNQACFVELWLRLERTRQLLEAQYKRFCIRRVLKEWFGTQATDDFIWEVCLLCQQEGWTELPPPALAPRVHREMLRAVTATYLKIGMRKVSLKELDTAYSIAFPHSKRLNVNKENNS